MTIASTIAVIGFSATLVVAWLVGLRIVQACTSCNVALAPVVQGLEPCVDCAAEGVRARQHVAVRATRRERAPEEAAEAVI